MSVTLPIVPAWMQDKGYSARDDRAVIAALGNGVVTGYDVSPGAGMSVIVQPGLAVVPGTRSSAQGSYLQRSTSPVTVPWPAAGASQRVDQLYLQIRDNTEITNAGGLPIPDESSIMDVAQQGSAVPADSLVLATVVIPASASSILAANITSGAAARFPVAVSSLPASAADGQEVALIADATAGVIWRFKYRAGSASAYKWEFIGGSPLVASEGTLSNHVISQAIGTVNVSDATTPVPREGDYMVRLSGQISANAGAGQVLLTPSVQLTAGGPNLLNLVQSLQAVTTLTTGTVVPYHVCWRLGAVPAGSAARGQVSWSAGQTSSGNTALAGSAMVEVLPIRVK